MIAHDRKTTDGHGEALRQIDRKSVELAMQAQTP